MHLETSPRPFELIKANEHHGAYIVNAYGGDVCDFYAMSNPFSLSVRNGGDSKPIPFTCADGNAEFMLRAANAHDALVEALRYLDSSVRRGADQSVIRDALHQSAAALALAEVQS